jgi:hypothetical protein
MLSRVKKWFAWDHELEHRAQQTIDQFALAVTPLWFEWLNWVLIMAVLRYAADVHGVALAWTLLYYSYLAVFYYSMAHTWRFCTSLELSVKRRWLSILVTMLIAGIPPIVVNWVVGHLVTELAGKI